LVQRGLRVAVWALFLLATLALAVIVPVEALRAHGTEGFDRWVGWAAIAVVPLTAGVLVLTFSDKIIASLTHQRDDQDQRRSQSEPEESAEALGARGPDWPGDTLLARNPNFTGRGEALENLEGLLAAGPVAVVAVRGLGGVGKSQLALEYAYRMRATGRYWLAGWVRADTPLTIAEDLAELAPSLGLTAETAVGETAAKVIRALGSRPDWLIVFDNAQAPDGLAGMLPRGQGHILITSRNRVWSGLATQMDLAEFSRTESVEFVSGRSGADEPEAANELATELGDLPLALAQAAAHIDNRSMSIRGYLDSYRDPALAQRLRDAGVDSTEYPASVARTWLMSVNQLSSENPPAVDLLRLCAFLDPNDIDLDLLSTGRAEVSGVLVTVLDRERAEIAGALAARSLVTISGQDHLRVHRLVQAVTRDQLDDAQALEWARQALDLVTAILPPDPGDYRVWPTYARLAPHIEAVTGHARFRPLQGQKLELLKKLGVYLSESEQLWAARTTFERVLEIQEAAYGDTSPEIAKTLDNLGAVQLRLGELGNARASLERALEISETADPPYHPEVARALVNLGGVQLRLGELENARASLERALEISEEAYGPDNPEVATALINLGGVQTRLGELGNAHASLERALVILRRAHGEDHPEVASALVYLGAVQVDQGELGVARASVVRALEIRTAVYGPDHPWIASALINLGVIQLRLSELANACASLQRGLEISAAVRGPDHPEVASALVTLGAVQLRQGEPDKACAGLQRALEISETVYGQEHPEVARIQVGLAVAQLRMRKLKSARASLRRALTISAAAHGSGHRTFARTLIDMDAVRHDRLAKCLVYIFAVRR
jgi:Tfp pilus assembly protein PilF